MGTSTIVVIYKPAQELVLRDIFQCLTHNVVVLEARYFALPWASRPIANFPTACQQWFRREYLIESIW